MSDNTFKLIVWGVIAVLTAFIAQYIILRTPLTLIITILWSIVLVLYIHFKYSNYNPIDEHSIEREKDSTQDKVRSKVRSKVGLKDEDP